MKRALSPVPHSFLGLLRAFAIGGSLMALPAAALASTPATGPLPVSVQAVDQEYIRVRVDNPLRQAGQVQVLRVSNGQVLFSEAYATDYGHRFSFRDLPAGRYALLLRVGNQQYRYNVDVPAQSGGPAVAIRSIKVRLPKPAAAATTAAL